MVKAFKKILHNKDGGFSLIEMVIAVGTILVLTIGGFLSYKALQNNSRIALTNSVAQSVFTKSVANKNDSDDSSTPFKAAQEYYATKGDDHLTILMPKGDNGEPITILVINDAITMNNGYFYYSYRSEESTEAAEKLVQKTIQDCIDYDGCNNVPKL